MPTHTAVNGRTIEYEPSAAEARFLRRVEAELANKASSENDLRSLIYGPDNPLLDQQAGYSFVTPAAFASPVFRVLLDLLDQKRVRTGSLDVAKAAAQYTLTIAEAAERLGVGASTVRMAILDGRLPSWVKEGQTYLAPTSVDSYRVSRRGLPPRLAVVCGSRDGASMRVRVIGGDLEETSKESGIVQGQVTRWERVAVITGAKRKSRDGASATTYRYWLLEPGGTQQQVELGPFAVSGRFTIVEEKNGKAASDAWHALKGAEP